MSEGVDEKLLKTYHYCWEYLKFYQELLLKFLLGFITLSGTILYFHVEHHSPVSHMSLLLPIIIGAIGGLFTLYAIKWGIGLQKVIEQILKESSLLFLPTAESYITLLFVSGIVDLLIAAGFLWLFCSSPALLLQIK